MSETLIIFSRYPEAGKTKTRMIPALGAEGVAKLQRAMTEHTLHTVKQLSETRPITSEIHFAGGNQQLMSEWLGREFIYYPQVAGDLGEKMRSAFDRAFARGNSRVVTIGIDCPDINESILATAFEALMKRDLVLGVAEDGGYYAIGLNRSIPELFANIDWGTDKVLTQTKNIAIALGLKIYYLPCLRDVDRPKDLFVWQKYR
ncbi:TIGR04282 family arsenosugar biosynthesis glycosyltransferase [Myxosarcina sp. GI1(2024)]